MGLAAGGNAMERSNREYDETTDEHDVVGEWAHQENAVAAD